MTHSLAAGLVPGGPSAKTRGMLVPSAVVADSVKLYEGEPKEPYGRSAHDTGIKGPCLPMRADIAGAADAARSTADRIKANITTGEKRITVVKRERKDEGELRWPTTELRSGLYSVPKALCEMQAQRLYTQ